MSATVTRGHWCCVSVASASLHTLCEASFLPLRGAFLSKSVLAWDRITRKAAARSTFCGTSGRRRDFYEIREAYFLTAFGEFLSTVKPTITGS